MPFTESLGSLSARRYASTILVGLSAGVGQFRTCRWLGARSARRSAWRTITCSGVAPPVPRLLTKPPRFLRRRRWHASSRQLRDGRRGATRNAAKDRAGPLATAIGPPSNNHNEMQFGFYIFKSL